MAKTVSAMDAIY